MIDFSKYNVGDVCPECLGSGVIHLLPHNGESGKRMPCPLKTDKNYRFNCDKNNKLILNQEYEGAKILSFDNYFEEKIRKEYIEKILNRTPTF